MNSSVQKTLNIAKRLLNKKEDKTICWSVLLWGQRNTILNP